MWKHLPSSHSLCSLRVCQNPDVDVIFLFQVRSDLGQFHSFFPGHDGTRKKNFHGYVVSFEGVDEAKGCSGQCFLESLLKLFERLINCFLHACLPPCTRARTSCASWIASCAVRSSMLPAV